MKYYAVTEDPRELYHYGVKGMKWGQHLFGEDLRPKSPAYKRAASKLKAGLTNKIKSFRSNSNARSAQREINKRAKEQNNYMKSVMKTQKRLNMLDSLSKLDQEKAAYKQSNNIQKINTRDDKYAKKFEQINAKAAVAKTKQDYKQAKKSLKAEKHMNKLLQEAREGRLHYGQLSEEQISRVQNRLNMEDQARKLGGKEKPSWRQQKKEARRAGVLKGITAGTSAAMEEVARAGAIYGINHILDRQKLKSAAKQEGKENKAKQRAQNKKTHRDVKQDLKQELYEEQIRSGEGVIARTFTGKTAKARANNLYMLQRQNKLRDKYQDYLEENNLTDKQARKLYRENLDSDEKSKFGSVRGPKMRKSIATQQAKLLAAVNKQKEDKRKDEQFRDKVYDKYIMGGKNSTPKEILERYQDSDVYQQIYGKGRKNKEQLKLDPVEESFNSGTRRPRTNRIPTRAENAVNNALSTVTSKWPRVQKTPIQKSIERQEKKRNKQYAKSQRAARSRLNGTYERFTI
jgi:hypothetical protein